MSFYSVLNSTNVKCLEFKLGHSQIFIFQADLVLYLILAPFVKLHSILTDSRVYSLSERYLHRFCRI